MEKLKSKESNFEDLPFNVEKQENCLIVSAKPPKKKLSKKEKLLFEKNKVMVEVVIFDKEYIEYLHKIQATIVQEWTFNDFLNALKNTFVKFMMK